MNSSSQPEDQPPRSYLTGAIIAAIGGAMAMLFWGLVTGMGPPSYHMGWPLWYVGCAALILAAVLFVLTGRNARQSGWRRTAYRTTTYLLGATSAVWGIWGVWQAVDMQRPWRPIEPLEPTVAEVAPSEDDSITFPFRSNTTSANGQLLEAAIYPEPRTDHIMFRLWLPSPGIGAKRNAVVRAVLLRGEPGGEVNAPSFFSPTFGSYTLLRAEFERSRNGRIDSLPLVLTVRVDTSGQRPWVAEALLPNGGRFLLSLDERTRHVGLRRIDSPTDLRVYSALMRLVGAP